MMVVLVGGALAVACAPLVAIVLVSVASRREDRAWSLAGHPRGQVQAVARRILACRCEGPVPRPRSHVRARPAPSAAMRAGEMSGQGRSRQQLVDTYAATIRAR